MAASENNLEFRVETESGKHAAHKSGALSKVQPLRLIRASQSREQLGLAAQHCLRALKLWTCQHRWAAACAHPVRPGASWTCDVNFSTRPSHVTLCAEGGTLQVPTSTCPIVMRPDVIAIGSRGGRARPEAIKPATRPFGPWPDQILRYLIRRVHRTRHV